MNQGEAHEVTGPIEQAGPKRRRLWRRHRRRGENPVIRAVGVFGGVLCMLSFLMLVAAGLWWVGSRVWDAVPGGAGVLAGIAFGCCLLGGTLASIGGETEG